MFRILTILSLFIALTACDTFPDSDCGCSDGDLELLESDSDALDADAFDIDAFDSIEDSDVVVDGDLEHEVELDQEVIKKPAPAECLLDADCNIVMVAAHRGYHANHPENSLAAIRDSAAIGCEFAEVDVRHTKDLKLVLMHDDSIKRTIGEDGLIEELTWAEISQKTLLGAESGNPESEKVPLFSAALSLAKELGLMIYIDQKTSRTDLVLLAIQEGDYYEQALVRDDLSLVEGMAAKDSKLIVMIPVQNEIEIDQAIQAIPNLKIIEITKPAADKALTDYAHSKGLKVQQDVMAAGDITAMFGDYKGWKKFVDAGVFLLQTDLPALLVPAVNEYNKNGTFPEEGDGLEL